MQMCLYLIFVMGFTIIIMEVLLNIIVGVVKTRVLVSLIYNFSVDFIILYY